MFNSLEMTAISQYGFRNESSLDLRRKASIRFFRALNQGQWRALWSKLTGQESQLRDLSRSHSGAQHQPPRSAGVVNVSLSEIVGSENRVKDFDNAFHPLNSQTQDRWISIAVARARGAALPPVELIQARDGFYVRDGHHRISVARASGQAEIEARIAYQLV